MTPFRSSAMTGFQETEIVREDVTLTLTACGALLGSEGKIVKFHVHLRLNISARSTLSLFHVFIVCEIQNDV